MRTDYVVYGVFRGVQQHEHVEKAAHDERRIILIGLEARVGVDVFVLNAFMALSFLRASSERRMPSRGELLAQMSDISS